MEFFGLDIGSHTLKAVQLGQAGGGKYILTALGSAPSTQKGLLSEAETDLVALAEAIKKLCQEIKIKTKNVAAALPQNKVFSRVITFPQLSEEELNSALKWEAEQYVPIPLEEVTLSHQIVGRIKEDHKEKIEVLLVAAPNRLIEKTIKVLNLAGLRPVSLETEITAMARSLAAAEMGTVMLLDLGAKATDLAVVENSQVVFVHSLATGGETLTRALELRLGLESTQAESYKKAYGVNIQKLEGKVGQALEPVLEIIVKEIKKIIQFLEQKRTIRRLIITGGTAGLPEVATFLTEKLNLEIQLGNPFSRLIEDGLLTKIPSETVPLYAIAVGLAMKGF